MAFADVVQTHLSGRTIVACKRPRKSTNGWGMDRLLLSVHGNNTTGASMGWRREKWISKSYFWPDQKEFEAPRISCTRIQDDEYLREQGWVIGTIYCLKKVNRVHYIPWTNNTTDSVMRMFCSTLHEIRRSTIEDQDLSKWHRDLHSITNFVVPPFLL